MKRLRFKFGAILFCIVCIVLCSVSSVYAEGYDSKTEVTFEAVIFDVSVPSVLPISVDEKGVVTVSDTYYIQNESAIPIRVVDVQVIGENGWEIADYDKDFTKEQVNIKEVGFSFNGEGISKYGILDTSDWGAIGSKSKMQIEYDVNLARQTQDIVDTEIATVQFVLDWNTSSTIMTPSVSGVPMGNKMTHIIGDEFTYPTLVCKDYEGNTIIPTLEGEVNPEVEGTYTLIYTIIDSYGNSKIVTIQVIVESEVLEEVGVYDNIEEYYTYGYKYGGMTFSLTADFKEAVNSTNGSFEDSKGRVWTTGMPLPNPGSEYNGENIQRYIDLFYGYSSMEYIDLSLWDVSNVSDFTYMFSDCSSLVGVSLDGWKFDSAEVLAGMFSGCSSLEELDMSTWTFYLEMNCMDMFFDCYSLKTVLFGENTLEHCVSTTNMFYNCTALESISFENMNMQNVEDASAMFYGCTSLKSISFENTNISSLWYIPYMFAGCSSLTTLDISRFRGLFSDESALTSVFYGCSSLWFLCVSDWEIADSLSKYSNIPSNCLIDIPYF